MPDPFASFIDPRTGRPVLTNRGVPAGTQYFQSEGITVDPTTGQAHTASGDANNAFRGYVGPQGGQFGPSAGKTLDQGGILSILGGNPGQYDALAGRIAADPALYGQWQGLLQGNVEGIKGGLASSDPELQAIAQGYANNWDISKSGWQNPFAQSGVSGPLPPPANEPAPQNPDPGIGGPLPAPAPEPAPDSDPFGRFDDPANPAHPVQTPQSGQVTAQAGAGQPYNPFAPFQAQAPAKSAGFTAAY